MNPLILPIAVIMQRRVLTGRWATQAWEVHSVLRDPGGARSFGETLVQGKGLDCYWFGGLQLVLYRDELEGYYLNVSAPEPKVFVLWRLEDDVAVPLTATVSYHEAARSMDGGEQVDAVAMPPEVYAWVGDYVESHYRPELKRVRRRDQSPFQEHGKVSSE